MNIFSAFDTGVMVALLLGIEFLRSDIQTILYCKRNDPGIFKSCLYTLFILLASLYSIVAGAMLNPEPVPVYELMPGFQIGVYGSCFLFIFLVIAGLYRKILPLVLLGYAMVYVIGVLIPLLGYVVSISIVVEKWKGKPYRLVIQRQRRADDIRELWEGEYTYRCILTNDFESDIRDVVEFYNLRGGKERILDDMNNGFGWKHLPKSFMAENAVYLLMTALIRNFYKTIIRKLNVKDFGLSISSRIKTFVFKYISVAAKWIRTSRTYVLNIYTENPAYKIAFQQDFG